MLSPGTGLTASDLAPLGWADVDADHGGGRPRRRAGGRAPRLAHRRGGGLGPVVDAAVARLTKADATLAEAG